MDRAFALQFLQRWVRPRRLLCVECRVDTDDASTAFRALCFGGVSAEKKKDVAELGNVLTQQ
jgi:hypothetical protein